jgi:low temperature requirement protein LtrA
MWIVAILLDVGGPFLFGAEGWKLVPHHFAERHGLVMIIALGESLVAIAIGAEVGLSALVIVAAVLGAFLACAMWWTYFDVLAPAATERLAATPVGRQQNDMARDAYSYVHFLLVAGVAISAVGLKAVLAHGDEPLDSVSAAAMVGGTVVFLLGTVAFKLRTGLGLSRVRLLTAAVVLALVWPALSVDARFP